MVAGTACSSCSTCCSRSRRRCSSARGSAGGWVVIHFHPSWLLEPTASFFVPVPANRGQTRGCGGRSLRRPIAGELYAQSFPIRSDRRSVHRRDNCSVRLQQRRIVVGGPIGRRRERRCSCDNRRRGRRGGVLGRGARRWPHTDRRRQRGRLL